MSEVMISDRSQPVCLEQLRKALSNIVGLDKIANLIDANIIYIARRYTRVQCAIIGFAVLTTGYIYFAPAIDLCVFVSIIDIEMCL